MLWNSITEHGDTGGRQWGHMGLAMGIQDVDHGDTGGGACGHRGGAWGHVVRHVTQVVGHNVMIWGMGTQCSWAWGHREWDVGHREWGMGTGVRHGMFYPIMGHG